MRVKCEELIDRKLLRFMGDAAAREQYEALGERGEYLQTLQMQGLQISETDIAEFEKQREALFSNPLARGFIEAVGAMAP